MIQIIRGVYGHYVTDKKSGKIFVVARDKNSDPFELTPEQEARLVSQGVARYVDDAEAGAAPIGFDEQPPEEEEPMEELSAKELRERGKEYGLSFKVGMTKAEMIEALRGEWPQEGETDGAPTFDAAEAVQ
ncbi:MAG: hypothetical protein SPF77_03355 [Gemmiger sp.]|uniref:hypothetical protein n=1 Tax=Gemmiger sp. TaxID=2049027 RepID=UPI002A90BF7E|nr:hypothetical protein [Gemmiger sp.]MDY5501601.1 hypothetical protein [Gemmiger sp.]